MCKIKGVTKKISLHVLINFSKTENKKKWNQCFLITDIHNPQTCFEFSTFSDLLLRAEIFDTDNVENSFLLKFYVKKNQMQQMRAQVT